jgi:hypothetical protein
MESLILFVVAYWPLFALGVPALLGLVYALLARCLHGEVLKAVGAAYRVAIHEAVEWSEDGIAWLRGSQGVALRRKLANAAYDALPMRIWVIPVGLVKLVVNREKWCSWVDGAFEEMVEMAEKLELPKVVEVTLE